MADSVDLFNWITHHNLIWFDIFCYNSTSANQAIRHSIKVGFHLTPCDIFMGHNVTFETCKRFKFNKLWYSSLCLMLYSTSFAIHQFSHNHSIIFLSSTFADATSFENSQQAAKILDIYTKSLSPVKAIFGQPWV